MNAIICPDGELPDNQDRVAQPGNKGMAMLADWMAGMNAMAPEGRRAPLIFALREILQSPDDPSHMLAGLLEADCAWFVDAEAASRKYRHDSFSARPTPERFHWEMSEIGNQFGQAFAACAHALAAVEGATALADDLLLQSIAHALFHYGQYVKWLGCNREHPRTGMWQEMHQLFEMAARRRLAVRPLLLFRSEEQIATCAQLWLRAVMVMTLNTGNLSPRQIDRSERWLAEWCKGIAIDEKQDPSLHLYCVDLGADAGAQRAGSGLPAARPVYLRTSHLYGEIVKARSNFLGESIASSLGLYAKNPLREYLDLLDQLQRAWASAPADTLRRSSPRLATPAGTPVEVVQGFDRILALHEQRSGGRTDAGLWTLRDYSEGGVGLAVPRQTDRAPATLQVIALRMQGETAWRIGTLVRVIILQSQGERLAGVRLKGTGPTLISIEEVVDVPVRGAARRPSEDWEIEAPPRTYRVFFLPGDEHNNRADSLLCAAGTFKGARNFRLRSTAREYIIRMNRVIEGTNDWERIGFHVQEKRPLAQKP